jgi:hypothetical protein
MGFFHPFLPLAVPDSNTATQASFNGEQGGGGRARGIQTVGPCFVVFLLRVPAPGTSFLAVLGLRAAPCTGKRAVRGIGQTVPASITCVLIHAAGKIPVVPRSDAPLALSHIF